MIFQSSAASRNGQFSVNLQKAANAVIRTISAVRPGDWRGYFCALRMLTVRGTIKTVRPKPQSLYPRLTCCRGWGRPTDPNPKRRLETVSNVTSMERKQITLLQEKPSQTEFIECFQSTVLKLTLTFKS